MQSDGNSFGGYVALYSINNASRAKTVFYTLYKKCKYFRIYIMKILNFRSNWEKNS